MPHTSEIILRYAFEPDIDKEQRQLIESLVKKSLNFHDDTGFMISFGISYDDFPPTETSWVRIFLRDVDDNAQFIIDKTEEIVMEVMCLRYYDELVKDIEKLKS